jgi:hypothetical protein
MNRRIAKKIVKNKDKPELNYTGQQIKKAKRIVKRGKNDEPR